MFLGDSIIFWFFGALVTGGLGTVLVSIRRIHLQVNRALPADQKMDFMPWPRTAKEFILRTYLRGHWWNMLYLHEQYYPSSSLRKIFFIAFGVAVLSFMGLAVSAR